jgi:hypothetical protein
MEKEDLFKDKRIGFLMEEWKNGWNFKIEKMVQRQGVKSFFNKIMHENACSYYNKKDKVISIVSIILVTLTATGSVTTASMNDSVLYRVSIGIILYIIAFITAMKEFLKLTQLTEKHRLYSMRFSALNNNIESQMALDIEDRQDGSDYMGWINSEIDNLLFSNPTIPTKIKRNTEKKFNDMFKEISTPLSFNRTKDCNEEKETVIDIPEIDKSETSSEEMIKRVRVVDFDTFRRDKRNTQKERSMYELNRLSDHNI